MYGVGECGLLRWKQVADVTAERRREHGDDIVAADHARVIKSVR